MDMETAAQAMDLAGDHNEVPATLGKENERPPTINLEPKDAKPNFNASKEVFEVPGPVGGALPLGQLRVDGEPARRILQPPPVPHRISDSDGLWRGANRLAASLVDEQTKSMNGSLDTTLIFAGLFSAVNSTLLAISLPYLSPGASDETNQLLRLLVTNNHSMHSPAPFHPTPSAIRDNILFAISLLFSLFAAFGAVLGKQWLIYYTSVNPGISDKKEAEERQAKIEGAAAWQLQLILEMVLPTLLQISLTLFIIGMIDFFYSIYPVLGIWNASFGGLATVIFFITIFLAVIYPRCPYQSPISMIVWPAMRRSIPQTLPLWFTFDFPDEHYERLPIPKGWPSINTWRWGDFITKWARPTVSTDDLVCQCVSFTFQKTDEPTNLLPAALIIPSLTSKEASQKLASESGTLLLNLFQQTTSQLEREALAGCEPDTLTDAALFGRALLHFYVSESSIHGLDWTTWWSNLYWTLSNLSVQNAEIDYLKIASGAYDRSFPSAANTPPPVVYLAAALMLHAEQVQKSETESSARTAAQSFVVLAVAALSQGAPWASLSMTLAGLQYIRKVADNLSSWRRWNSWNDVVPHADIVGTPPIRNLLDEKAAIWKDYTTFSYRRQDLQLDWVKIQELFDAQSEELDSYLSDSTNPIWGALVQKIVHSQRHDDQETSRLRLVETLGTLWRRLDTCQMSQLQRGLESNFLPAIETVEKAFKAAVKRWQTGNKTLGQSWAQLATAGTNTAYNYDHSTFVISLMVVSLDPKPGPWQQNFLKEHPEIISSFGVILTNSYPVDSIADAALWALKRQRQQWFDHHDHSIHSMFIEARMAPGVIRALARTLARVPNRGGRAVVQDVQPLFSLLLRHPPWVAVIADALAEGSIKADLALAKIKPGSDDYIWQTDEEGLRLELAKEISDGGVELILTEWYRMKTPDGVSSTDTIDAVWYRSTTIDTIVNSIKRRLDYDSSNLIEALRLYVETLRSIGRDRFVDAERVRAVRKLFRRQQYGYDVEDDMEDYHTPTDKTDSSLGEEMRQAEIIIVKDDFVHFEPVGGRLGPAL